MNSPRFSILIPVFNVEKYLRNCLDSVMSQTFSDFEVVIIDDGSTDASRFICDEYQEKFPDKMRVKHRENKGLLLTRREEIGMSKGEFLIFVDSDDWVSPYLLERIDKTIRKFDSDLVIYNFLHVFPNGEKLKSGITLQHEQLFSVDRKKELYNYFISTNRLNTIWCKAVRRDIIDIDADYSICKVTIGEDLLQSLPILTNAKKIIYIDDILYYYRKEIASMTGSMKLDYLDSFSYVNRSMLNYMCIWGVEESRIREYKANELSFYINSYLRLLYYDHMLLEEAMERLHCCEAFVLRTEEVRIRDFENKRMGFRVRVISTWICRKKYRMAKVYLGLIHWLSGIRRK